MTSDQKKFEFGQTVYTKDGEKYFFDHAIGENAHVAQFYQQQILNHDGTDFEEQEEVSEFLTRVPLSKLSSEPWVPIIEAETAKALAEKKASLSEINGQIGEATMELRAIEARASNAEKASKAELASLAKKYRFVRDIQSMVGDRPTYFVHDYQHGNHPQVSVVVHAQKVVFTKKGDVFEARSYDEDTTREVQIFHSKPEMERHIRNVFLDRKDRSIEQEIKWVTRHPFLDPYVSPEAKKEIVDKATALKAHRKKQLEQELDRVKSRLQDLENEGLS